MYYDEYEEEQMFLPEFDVMERVHYEVPTASRMEMQNDPVKRFYVYTNAIAMSLSSNKLLDISLEDVNQINALAKRVRNPQFKNAHGFVLGYYITINNSISNTRLEQVKKLLTLPDYKFIKLEDLIRYARLFITQL